MLKLENFSKKYGEIQAVDNISIELMEGKITILAGADGAGKSTIFRMIVGLVSRDSGAVYLNEEPIDAGSDKLNAIIGYMPERFSLYPDLSVEENMNFFADIYGVKKNKREDLKQRLLEKTGMLPFRKRRAGALSGGMKQKLALSTILLSSPSIIILDEPTTGVDPLSRIEFFNIIEELRDQGKTILISTPYMDEAEKGDDIVFLKNGRILRQETIQQLKENFPATVYQISPEVNVFDLLKHYKNDPVYGDFIFMRGNQLRFTKKDEMDFPNALNKLPKEIVTPSLEDIFLFYERMATGHGTAD